MSGTDTLQGHIRDAGTVLEWLEVSHACMAPHPAASWSKTGEVERSEAVWGLVGTAAMAGVAECSDSGGGCATGACLRCTGAAQDAA